MGTKGQTHRLDSRVYVMQKRSISKSKWVIWEHSVAYIWGTDESGEDSLEYHDCSLDLVLILPFYM